MKLSKAIRKMNAAGKKLKPEISLPKDPKEAAIHKRMLAVAEKVKREGIQ